MVFITFAGHGHAGEGGRFFLQMQETGPGNTKQVSPEFLARGVSSDELATWLRDVDAGELVLVVDACHSAAAVEAEGFRPGPMGSRGLGQLAYDKGMRVLTASQADDVALEIGRLQHGLMTYALVIEGLVHGKSDWKPQDRRIDVAEWLGYGVERVPSLETEARTGTVQAPTRGATPVRAQVPGGAAGGRSRGQRPALFDFLRQSSPTAIAQLR
jgi:hypothetical protein